MQCPCNPNKLYADCCKKAHKNITSVSSAEELMRSRYAAFVLADVEYLQISHHSSTRSSTKEKNETLDWTKSVDWIKLDIINSTKNTVEFKAFFMEKGKLEIIHENSFFCLENGHLVYKNAIH